MAEGRPDRRAFVLLTGTPADELKLGKVPDHRPAPRPPVDANRIKKPIADLAAMDGAGVGFSATLGGDDFATVPGPACVARFVPCSQLRPLTVARQLNRG